MINSYAYIPIGIILKAYRREGYILVDIDKLFWPDMLKCKAIFLRVNGLEVPFFIEDIDLDINGSILKLEEFNSPEDIVPWNNTSIYLRKRDVSVEWDNTSGESEEDLWQGFNITDISSELEFEILEIVQLPQQLMAVVKHDEKEILIPMVDDFIDSIDEQKKIIKMNFPEGLLDQ